MTYHDLIAKLRYLADCGQEELGSVPVPLLREAAAEIERLRKVVKWEKRLHRVARERISSGT